MTYRGHVKNGVVVLDGPARLPEGASVRVEPVVEEEGFESLRKGLLQFAGTVKGMPADMARNHDRYLHGAPRK